MVSEGRIHIRFSPDDVDAEILPGTSILQAALDSGIPHAHACGGVARCSTCRVEVTQGLDQCPPRNDIEGELAARLSFPAQLRLACQTSPTGNVSVRRLVLDLEDIRVTSQLRRKRLARPVGEERLLTVMFADVRGFTSFAARLPPYDVIHVLNRYHRLVGRAIEQNGGFVNSYMGDGLMALFGLESPDDAPLGAVRAGLGMLVAVEYMGDYLEALYAASLRIGIGIHHGEVVVGTVGTTAAAGLTAIGHTVNVASRLEALTKEASAGLLVSEEVYAKVHDQVIVGRSLLAALPGLPGQHRVHEIVGLA